MANIRLSEIEIRMLIQSLDHCLATCNNEQKTGSSVCEDCVAAKTLREKLSTELVA
jgi:hypothetical protein